MIFAQQSQAEAAAVVVVVGGGGGQVMLGCILARCASAIKIPAEHGTLAPPLAARRKRS